MQKGKMLLVIATTLLFFSCHEKKAGTENNTTSSVSPCDTIKDTFTTTYVFAGADDVLPSKDFYEIVRVIERKGDMRLLVDKKKDYEIRNWKDAYLMCTIDTCNKKFVNQYFVLKNIGVTTCTFKSITPLKGKEDEYYPYFDVEQWHFTNNTDRDKAYQLVRWVWETNQLGKKVSMKTVLGDRRLYILETRANIFINAEARYAELLRKYLAKRTIE